MEYHVFECCRFVKGHNRSVINDLGRKEHYFVPGSLARMVKEDGRFVPDENDLETSMEYQKYLLQKEFIYKAENEYLQTGFTKLDLSWDVPSHIENCVISLDKEARPEALLPSVIGYLKELNCFHVQLRLTGKYNEIDINTLLGLFDNTRVQTIELLFEYDGHGIEFLKKLCNDFLRIQTVVLYNAPLRKVENFGNDALGNIVHVEVGLSELLKSGVQDYQFVCNMPMFTEAQQHHTYFNRKLYIDPKGEIKNAPECKETFSNINELKDAEELKAIVATPEFQKYWYVRKDDCDVCKDCEFRYMCTDNRLPHQRTDGSWCHQVECNYNPYICKWKDEEDYSNLAECGVVSNEKGFSCDEEKISTLNAELWPE